MFFHNESLGYIRDLKVMNDRRDFELTSSDKNIEIRPEVVMFILVCSMAAFNFSTAHKNVTHFCLKKRFVSRVCCNESLSYIRDLKATKMFFSMTKEMFYSLR